MSTTVAHERVTPEVTVLFFCLHHIECRREPEQLLAPAADISESALEDLCIQVMGATNHDASR